MRLWMSWSSLLWLRRFACNFSLFCSHTVVNVCMKWSKNNNLICEKWCKQLHWKRYLKEISCVSFSPRWWFYLQGHFPSCPKGPLGRCRLLRLKEREMFSVTPTRWALQLALTAAWKMYRFFFFLFVCFLLHHWLEVVLLKPCLQEEDDEYQEEKSLMGDTNNKEEGDETEEKILISKRFHLVSLKQTYTQKHLLWIKSVFFLLGYFETMHNSLFCIFTKGKNI